MENLKTAYIKNKKEILFYTQLIRRISKFTEDLINKYETNDDKKKELYSELLKIISFGYENENIISEEQ